METIVSKLDPMEKEIKDTLTDFLINHSSIAPMNLDEVYCSTPEGTRFYNNLNSDGAKMQSSLSKSYEQFYSMLCSALKDQPENVSFKLIKSREVITRAIEHKLTWCNSTQEVLQYAVAALDGQLSILKHAYGENIEEINAKG